MAARQANEMNGQQPFQSGNNPSCVFLALFFFHANFLCASFVKLKSTRKKFFLCLSSSTCLLLVHLSWFVCRIWRERVCVCVGSLIGGKCLSCCSGCQQQIAAADGMRRHKAPIAALPPYSLHTNPIPTTRTVYKNSSLFFVSANFLAQFLFVFWQAPKIAKWLLLISCKKKRNLFNVSLPLVALLVIAVVCLW